MKNSECIIFSGGHFPTSEDPAKFKEVITPVLKKILALDPDRRTSNAGFANRSTSTSSSRNEKSQAGGRRVIDL